jgi:pimeloyl-ACP methyl ester carboxylesterase
MTLHATLDRATIALSRRFFRRHRYFRDSIDSASLPAHLAGVRLTFPQLAGEQLYPIVAETLVGRLEAGVRVARWSGDRAPTLIYHHGTAESPFDGSFQALVGGRHQPPGANLVVVRAPFGGSFREFVGGIAELQRYAAMLMVSVAVIDALVAHCRERGVARVVVAGLSLGGFITNLHCLHRGSADVYCPLLAGAAMGSLFTTSIYRALVDPRALAAAESGSARRCCAGRTPRPSTPSTTSASTATTGCSRGSGIACSEPSSTATKSRSRPRMPLTQKKPKPTHDAVAPGRSRRRMSRDRGSSARVVSSAS